MRLDWYVGLLNKYHYRLRLECEDINVTINTLRITEKNEYKDHQQSAIHSICKRRSLVTDVWEHTRHLKRGGCPADVLSFFADLYSGMFHLTKRTTTETSWDCLLCQYDIANTYVDNINTVFVTDWHGFMVPGSFETDKLNAYEQLIMLILFIWLPLAFVKSHNRRETVEELSYPLVYSGMFLQLWSEILSLRMTHERHIKCVV